MQDDMTFVAAFYSFTIELNHADSQIFSSFRIKVPRHELESHEHFYARVIAYIHSYRPDIAFTNLIDDSREPTIVALDEIKTTKLWLEVGAPEKRKLELSLKQHSEAEHRIYFYQEDDLARFCHYLRGSKTNWVQHVRFYQLDSTFLGRLIDCESSSPYWRVSVIDDRIYLAINELDVESEITHIDIWEAFQGSI